MLANSRLWKAILNNDGQPFHQYQQNERPSLTINHWTQEKPWRGTLKIQVLAWDRHNIIAGLNRLMCSWEYGESLIRNKNCLPFASTWINPLFLGDPMLLIFVVYCFVLCFVLFCFICLRHLSSVPNVAKVSRLSILDCTFWFSLTFTSIH